VLFDSHLLSIRTELRESRLPYLGGVGAGASEVASKLKGAETDPVELELAGTNVNSSTTLLVSV
jgi:hypothetical protein